MDWQQFATNFGLPGLLIGVWYLLQSKRDAGVQSLEEKKLAGRQSLEEHKLGLEERRLGVEEKKAEALASALTSLSGKVDSHHTLDLQSHQDLGEGIARIETELAASRWYREEKTNPGTEPPLPPRRTPARGVRAPSRGQFRDTTTGDDDA